MDNFKICVIYTTRPDSREAFVEELIASGVLESIRKEDGCIRYEYYYSAEDECKLVLFEEWQSKTHQQVNMTQPHMKLAMEIKGKYVESVELKELKIF